MLRHGVRAVLALALGACALHTAPPSPSVRLGAAPAAEPEAAGPLSVPSIVLLEVSLPPAGRPVGSHLEGAQYAARVASLVLSEGRRERWSRAARAAGDSVLREAGFDVRSLGRPTSDAEALGDVRFGLSAEVDELSVVTTGRVSPVQVDVRAETVWELLDLAAGGVVLAVRTTGSARLTDSVDQAAVLALRRSLESLAADSNFRRALVSPPPRTVDEVLFGPAWARALPGPFDTLRLGPMDRNVAEDSDPVQRVAPAVFEVHGARQAVNAFVISRDGLALSAGVPVRERRLWARFHDGVERPVRVLRTSDGLALLEVACRRPCLTAPWSDTTPPRDRDRVFILGGPRWAGDAVYLATGRLGGSDGTELHISGDVAGGEPVALREGGTVIAVAAAGRAVPIGDALRQLGVATRGSERPAAPR